MIEAIDGTTRLFAIIGDPIHTVRSPEVFNALFTRHRANAVMFALKVSADDLARAWDGVKCLANLEGVIFTMPHKVGALSLVDHVGDTAGIVGAINAARRESDGTWTGDMFDGAGFVRGLINEGHGVVGKTAFVAGTGGAGSAIVAALARAGAARIIVDDLDSMKRDLLIRRTGAAFAGVDIVARTPGDPPTDMAINATPLGMRPTDPLPFDPSTLPPSTLVADVVTKPEMTPLLERAKATGHRVHSGRHMYLGQARDIAEFFRVRFPA